MTNPYTRLYNVLNTNWEAGVITKPSFFDLKYKNFRPANSIGIEFEIAPMGEVNSGDTEHDRVWNCLIIINANSDANRELMVEQITKHMRAYTSGTYRYQIETAIDYTRTYGLYNCTLTGQEYSLITTGAF